MSRIDTPSRDQAPADARPLLDAVQKKLGSVPNMFLVASQSPPVLEGLLALSGALSKVLDARTRERIAIAVASVNGCDYCLSAHTYLGVNLARLSPEEVALNRNGTSGDPRAAAAVNFAVKVARERGQVSDADLRALRAAGFDDAQVVAIVALVAENVFTNLLNNVALTEIDFPVVRTAEAA